MPRRLYPLSCAIFAACLLSLALAAAPLARAADSQLQLGKPAPAFQLPDQNDKTVSPADLRGKWVVLYFYPKDDTPGCTVQACDFSESISAFQNLNALVLGVSPDSTESHRAFIKKHNLKISLLSDPARKMMQAYNASVEGKTIRSTVILDPKGNVAALYPKVSPKGHADELKTRLAELQKK